MKMTASGLINLVLVDDSELVRAGLRAVLGTSKEIQIVGEAASVRSAVDVVRTHQPHVVLMDIRLPDGTGFEACRQIAKISPASRVLFLTSVLSDDLIADAIASGGQGYLLKEIDGPGLHKAIVDVATGKSILAPEAAERMFKIVKDGAKCADLDSLSPQETRVLTLISLGKTNKEVASDLNLSEKTVKNYLANVFDKLNVSRRSHAVALYVAAKS